MMSFNNFVALFLYIHLAYMSLQVPASLLHLPVFTRDSIYAIAHICYRLSVCLSVTRVYHRKRLKLGL